MSDQLQTMMNNIEEKTGKPFQSWVDLVRAQNFSKHGEIMKFLKGEHAFTHGYANLVAHKAKESDAGSITDKDAMIDAQYKGKEHFRPLYDQLIESILKLGDDVELAPKKSYISLRRKKQFGCLNPATKSRFEVGINLKGHPSQGMLQQVTKSSAMFTHQINISKDEVLSPEVIEWLQKAYENAG